MRAFTATFRAGFLYLWRNPTSVAILIVFPIVIILILGNALSSYIEVNTSLDPAPVAVVADPDGPLASYLKSEDISRFLASEFTDEAHARELLADGDVVAVILEKGGGLSVLRTPGGGTPTDLTLSIVDSYRQIGAAAAIAAVHGRNINEILALDVNVKDVPLGKRVPTATDYYAVTMLVMILLYTGLNGQELFGKSVLGETGSRVRLAPVSQPALIGGLLAASTVTSFLQGMVTFVFTAAVYGVYWGERIPLVLLTLFALVLFSQSLCIFFTMLFRAPGTASALTQGLIWTTTFVSKGYAKINFGEADKIFAYAPNALAHTVIFGAIYGGAESTMIFDLALLFGLGALLFTGAFLLGRRRLA